MTNLKTHKKIWFSRLLIEIKLQMLGKKSLRAQKLENITHYILLIHMCLVLFVFKMKKQKKMKTRNTKSLV